MAVTYQTASTLVFTANNAGATVAPAVAYPTGVAVGDLLVLVIGQKPNTTTMTTPTGWTLLGSFSGGAGTTGIDTGPTRIVVYTQEAASALTGNITMGTVANQNVTWGQCYRFSRSLPAWDVAITGGVDTTVGAAWSVLGGTVPAGWIAANDHLLIATMFPTDSLPTWASDAITCQGGGTVTLPAAAVLAAPSSTNSQDAGGRVARFTVTSSTQAAGTITHTATHSVNITNNSGPEAIIRIRDFTPVPPSAAAAPTVTSAGFTERIDVTTPASYPANGTSWSLYENINSGGAGSAFIAQPAGLNTLYSRTGLLATSSYTYSLSTSGPGGAASGTSSTAIVPTPAAPSFTLDIGDSFVDVGITARAYDAKYKVYRRVTAVGGAWTLVHTSATITGGSGVYTWRNTGLTNGTAYDFYVTTNPQTPTIRESAASATQSATPDAVYILVPDSEVSNASWTVGGGASSTWQALTDTLSVSDFTYVSCPLSSGVLEVGLGNPIGTPLTATIQAYCQNVAGVNLTIQLRQGTTTIATMTVPDNTFGLATPRALTAPELASITDWTDLRFRIFMSGTPLDTCDLYAVRLQGTVGAITPISASDTLSASVSDTRSLRTDLTIQNINIAASGDDGYSSYPGGTTFSSTGIRVSMGTQSGTSYRAFFRFAGVNMLSADTIESAVMKYTQSFTNGFPSVRFYLAAADNPTAPTTAAAVQALSLTTSYTSWAPSTSNNNITSTIDLSAQLAEIKARPGWVSGNAIMVVVDSDSSTDYFQAYAFDDGSNVPSLALTTSSAPASTPITASDTLSASVTDTASLVQSGFITASDTLSVAVTDVAAAGQTTKTASDTLSASVTDIAAAGQTTKTASDSLSAMDTETVVVLVQFSSTDSLAAAVTDVGAFSPITNVASDTLSASVADVGALVISNFVTASDTLSASVTEARSFGTVAVVASDTLSVSVADTSSPNAMFSAADTLSASVNDVATFGTIVFSTSDTLAASVTETASPGSVTLAVSDTLSVAITDASSVAMTFYLSASDALSAAVTENRFFNTQPITASDTLTTTVADAGVLFVPSPASDSLAVNLSETSQVDIGGLVTKSASDALTASVADSGAFSTVAVVASDTLSVAVTETATFATVAVVANDSLAASVSDVGAFPPIPVTASDALAAAVNDVGLFAPSQVNALDDLVATLSESRVVLSMSPGVDALIAQVVDTSSVAISGLVTVSAADALTAGVTEVGVFATVNVTANDTLSVNVTDVGVFAPVTVTATETLSAQVTDVGTFSTVIVTANDTPTASVNDTRQFGTVTVVASDALSAAITDASNVLATAPGTDGLYVSVVETSNITLSGTVNVAASDTLTGAVTESVQFATVAVTASDTLSVKYAGGAAVFGDDFNRADGAIGPNWTTPGASVSPGIISNQFGPTTAGAAYIRYVTECATDDEFSQATFMAGFTEATGPSVRVPVFGSTISTTGDYYLLSPNGTNTAIAIRKKQNLASTIIALGASAPVVLTAGDVIRLEVVGPDLVGYVNGVEIIRRAMSLSPLVAGGRGVGIHVPSGAQTVRWDNWSGGDLGATGSGEDAGVGLVTFSSSDSLNAAVAENVSFGTVTVTASDSLNVAVGESVSFGTVAVTANDSLVAADTESTNLGTNFPGQDFLNVSVNDVSGGIVIGGGLSIFAADTLTAAVTETVTNLATFASVGDTLSAGVTEARSFSTVQVVANDALTVTLAEGSSVFNGMPGNDTLAATVSETSSISIGGTFFKTASDGLYVTLSESVSFDTIVRTASDSLNVAVTDNGQFSTTNVTASDALAVSVNDVVTSKVALPGFDTLSVNVTETSQVQMAGEVSVAASDTLRASITENVSTFRPITATDILTINLMSEGVDFAPVLFSSADALDASVNDVGTFAQVAVSATDTLIAALADNRAFAPVAITGVDTLTVTLGDAVGRIAQLPGFDNLNVSVMEAASVVVMGIVAKAASDTLYTQAADEALQGYVRVAGAENLTVQVTEVVGFATVSVTGVENLLVALVDSAHVDQAQQVVAADTLTATLVEQADNSLAVFASDTLTAAIHESTQPIHKKNAREKRPVDWAINDDETYFSGYQGQTRRRRRGE